MADTELKKLYTALHVNYYQLKNTKGYKDSSMPTLEQNRIRRRIVAIYKEIEFIKGPVW